MPFNHLILCRPLLFLLSMFPSIRVFSSELGLCIRWPKYWSFSSSISPSSEYSGLISLRIDCFDLLCSPRDSQEFSPAPHYKASVLWCSAFFRVQLSHRYMSTEKTIALKKNLKNKGNHKVKSSLFSIDCGCTFKSCRWIATLIWQPGAVLACRPANLLRMVRQKIGKSPCLWWCRWVSKPILELAYFHTFCYLNFLYAKKQLRISLPDF